MSQCRNLAEVVYVHLVHSFGDRTNPLSHGRRNLHVLHSRQRGQRGSDLTKENHTLHIQLTARFTDFPNGLCDGRGELHTLEVFQPTQRIRQIAQVGDGMRTQFVDTIIQLAHLRSDRSETYTTLGDTLQLVERIV